MGSVFPSALDSFTDPSATSGLNNPSHSSQHVNLNAAVLALEAKVGMDGSAVLTSIDYRLAQITANPFISGLATTNSLQESGTKFYFTQARFDSTFAAKSTTDLAEGTNLYFTNARADARIVAQKGAVNGIASLDSGGKIPNAQLPSIAISDTFVVGSQAAMLALNAQTGDVAVRTDLNKSYIMSGTDPSNISSWQELLTPTDTVLSVNGQTGLVTLTTSNIAEGSNLYYTSSRFTTSFATKTTDSLTEGSTNLYFTAERVDDRVASLLQAGSNITLTYDDTNNMLTIASSGGGAVSSVSNSDGTLTISPTAGVVVASLALGHANTWTGKQTFNTSAPIFGTTTATTVPYIDASKQLVSSSVTPTELGYLSGVTSAIQTQLNSKGAGTVTSVGLSSTNSTLTIGSTPVTSSGTITADINLAHANTWTGAQTFGTATVGSDFYLSGVLTPAQITSNQNNYNPTGLSTASVLRLSSDTGRNVTGLAGGAAGRIITIKNVNAGSQIKLTSEDTNSTAANRFHLTRVADNGGDIMLLPNQTVILQYDAVISRWTNTAWTIPGGLVHGAGQCVIQINRQGYMYGDENFVWDVTNTRLGINTATPNATLHVVGAAIITGTTTINNVGYTWPSSRGAAGTSLTENGSGALTWQSNASSFSRIMMLMGA